MSRDPRSDARRRAAAAIAAAARAALGPAAPRGRDGSFCLARAVGRAAAAPAAALWDGARGGAAARAAAHGQRLRRAPRRLVARVP
eukprot:3476714-Prymnesium_polylepis.1